MSRLLRRNDEAQRCEKCGLRYHGRHSQRLCDMMQGQFADAIQAAARCLGPVRLGDVHGYEHQDPPYLEVIVALTDYLPDGRGIYVSTRRHNGAGEDRCWIRENDDFWRSIYRGHVSDFIASGLRAVTPLDRVVSRAHVSREHVFEDADALFAPLQAEGEPPVPGVLRVKPSRFSPVQPSKE